MSIVAKFVTRMMTRAGVTINGGKPWDIQVHRNRFYRQVMRGSVGLGESYMDGDWDVESLDALFRRFLLTDIRSGLAYRLNYLRLIVRAKLYNMQSRRRSRAVAEEHYDLDYRMYEQFLGPYNQYTCCFFDGTDDLKQAEINKLEMICQKLALKEDDRVLDIGCGWGGFAKYAAETRGCTVTGVTLSSEQADYAREYTAGLPVEIIAADYRDLPDKIDSKFDKVLICGMIEHVGYKNYRDVMRIVHDLLDDDGLFLLQTIGNSEQTIISDPWIEKYIFRNSMVPTIEQIEKPISGLFVVRDWKNYGHHYAETVSAWQANFDRNWEKIKGLASRNPFDEKFRRMWNYYLLSCKAAFDLENLLLWQIVMSKTRTGRPAQ